MTTFADPIENNPCVHDWYYESGNWHGTTYKCLYCNETKYEKHIAKMINC